jgi:hypothetical protein
MTKQGKKWGVFHINIVWGMGSGEWGVGSGAQQEWCAMRNEE